MEAITRLSSVVCCDNCNWQQDIDERELKDFVNKLCPECGFILLTEQAYLENNLLLSLIDFTNKIMETIDGTEEEDIEVSVKIG